MKKLFKLYSATSSVGDERFLPEAIRRLGLRFGFFLHLLVLLLTLSACIDQSVESGSKSKTGADDLELSSSTVYLSEINGQYVVSATYVDGNGVAYINQPEIQWQSSATDVVTVDSNGVITAKAMGAAQITVIAGDLRKTIDVVVSSNVVTISGRVQYEDREYGSSGFITQSAYYKAARFVKVDLLSVDNAVVQSAYTDGQGNFSFTGVIDSQQKVTAYSMADATQGLDLQIKDRSGLLYAVTANVSLDNNSFMAMDIPLSSAASGAFNILDVLTNAANFTLASTDLSSVSLSAFWQENNDDGTYFCDGYDSYYCTQGKGIYVYNQVGADTDEYDDDVLYHEFGHFFMDTISRDDSLGGCHLLSSKDLDLRLSWSEGFGDFFPAAVKHWLSIDNDRATLLSTPSNLSTTAYVDTSRNYAQISIALDTLDKSRYYSAANEMAIAKILYDLYLKYGMTDLVKVFSQYLPSVQTPVNLEAFWDGWLSVHNPDQSVISELQTVLNDRKVFYQQDAFENDADISSLFRSAIAKSTLETHYIYQPVNSGYDSDLIPFTVTAGKQYVAQTLNLGGGADTYLRIRDTAGNVLFVDGVELGNDDVDENAYYGYDSVCGVSRIKNNGTALASKVSFTASESGTYYVEVRTTIDADPYRSAGRYGHYDVMVQEF